MGPLGHRLAIDYGATGAVINFLGTLQSANAIAGPWINVTDASPCTLSATNIAMFYRGVE